MAGALRGDPETGGGCGPDDLGDLGGGPGYGDGGGALVGQVPRGAELVVAGIAGQVDVASAQAAERLGGERSGEGRAGISVLVISMVILEDSCRSGFGEIRLRPATWDRLGSRLEVALGPGDTSAPTTLLTWRSRSSVRRRFAVGLNRSISAPASSARCWPRWRCTRAGRCRWTPSSTCSGATRPPPAVTGTLQAYVAGLRKALEPDRAPRTPASILVTVGAGYALRVEPEPAGRRPLRQGGDQPASAAGAGRRAGA